MSPNASGPTRRSQRLAGPRPKPTRSTNKTERWRGFRSSDPPDTGTPPGEALRGGAKGGRKSLPRKGFLRLSRKPVRVN